MSDEKQEEKTYEVKDKRRVNADGSLKENVQPEPAQEQPAEAPAEAEGAEEEAEAYGGAGMPAPNVLDTLQFVTGLLVEQAWQFMGLHLPPGSKEPVTDLAQAKIAIDTVIFIADKLHASLSDEERRSIRGIVSDLQINFVQHSQK